MRLKRTPSLFLFQAIVYFIQETSGSMSQCHGRTPVVNICTNHEFTTTSNIYIETAFVPNHQKNTCMCNISPVKSNSNLLLSFLIRSSISKHVQFKINDEVLNKIHANASTILSDFNQLTLKTTPDFDKKDVCLVLSTADASDFNISCEMLEDRTIKSTYTTATDSIETSTNSRLDSGIDIDIKIIGVVIGGVVFVFLIPASGLAIYCKRCKRRTKTKKKNTMSLRTLSNIDKDEPETTVKDESDYYMTENPIYNMPEPATIATETQCDTKMNENTQFLLSMEDNGDNQTAGENDFIIDSTNDSSQPLMPEPANENNPNDTQKVL